MVIISILMIIYKFNWSWHQWKNNNIHFTCFCKIFNKSILFSFEMILTTSPPDKKNHSVRNTSFIYRYIYISSDYSQKKRCKLVINVLPLFQRILLQKVLTDDRYFLSNWNNKLVDLPILSWKFQQLVLDLFFCVVPGASWYVCTEAFRTYQGRHGTEVVKQFLKH